MTETQSYPFDLILVPNAIKKYNLSYSDDDFDGTNKWQLVISTICPDNIEDCLNNNGLLNGSVNNVANGDIGLELVEQDATNSYVKIKNNVTITLNDDVDVKGIFLRKKSPSNYVLMAMINQTPMRFCEKIMFEKDNILFQLILR